MELDVSDNFVSDNSVDDFTLNEVDANDSLEVALKKRQMSLLELVHSEESYIHRLRIAYELYIPAPYLNMASASTKGSSLFVDPLVTNAGDVLLKLSGDLPPGGPVVPEDLVARWRILWGNWLQILEWHTTFYEKLKTTADEDPDGIPKLFIDSRTRLRSIYSKYCENQIKAAHIAERYKDFFDEWRLHVGDKGDIVSLLMQPVQRIMRYQLPINEIVKWTEQAGLPSLSLWQRALDIMREIPMDAQLILEAARIDGFPGVVTALGTLRIRGDLLVVCLTRAELSDALLAYAKFLPSLTTPLTEALPQTYPTKISISSMPRRSLTTDTSIDPYSSESFCLTSRLSGDQLPPSETCVVTTDKSPWLPPGKKAELLRLFLFDRMLLLTEEVKVKRRGTTSESFSNSTYHFRAAINVNNMCFEPNWMLCNLVNAEEEFSLIRPMLELAVSEDFRFALWDQTPGRDLVYVIDPQTVANRSAWVVHLRDIQRMQQQLLLALEDPTHFSGTVAEHHWGLTSSGSHEDLGCTAAESVGNEHHSPSRKCRNVSAQRSSCSAFTPSISFGSTPHDLKPPPSLRHSRFSDTTPVLSNFECHKLSIPSRHRRCFSAERNQSSGDVYLEPLFDMSLSKGARFGSTNSRHRKQSTEICESFGDLTSMMVVNFDPNETLARRESCGFKKARKAFVQLFSKLSKRSQDKTSIPTSKSASKKNSDVVPISTFQMTKSCHASFNDDIS